MTTAADIRKSMQIYVSKLDSYLETLPLSDMIFIYFVTVRNQYGEEELLPQINRACRLWQIPMAKTALYIARNAGNDGFCHIYQESEINYRVFMEGNNVVAFEKHYPTYNTIGGGVHVGVHWGNHLTVGLLVSWAKKRLLLASHKTVYTPSDEQPNQAQANRIECNTWFEEALDNATSCIVNGVPSGVTVQSMYAEICQDPILGDILRAMKQVYLGNDHTSSGGGKYISVKGRKKYMDGNLHGSSAHGGIGDAPEVDGDHLHVKFVEFLRSFMTGMFAVRHDLSSVRLFYDKQAQGFMVRYQYGEENLSESDVFYVDKDLAQRAFAYENLSTIQKQSLPLARREAEETVVRDVRNIFLRVVA
jgi:hypothetical protein